MKAYLNVKRILVILLSVSLGLIVPLLIVWLFISLGLSIFIDLTLKDVLIIYVSTVLPCYILFSAFSYTITPIILKVKGARRPRQNELNILMPIVSELHKKCLPNVNLSLYVIDDAMNPNAMVLGESLIFTTGIINQTTRDELIGVTAHEFGHINYGDSKFSMFISFLMMPYELLSKIVRGILSICNSTPFLFLLIGLPLIVISIPLLIVSVLLNLLLLGMTREYEYRADRYAVVNGYGDGLRKFLDQLSNREDNKGLFERLMNTHPSSAMRLIKLENVN